jgi:hypothetical protein
MLTIPEAIKVPSGLIILIVFLEEDELLGIDKRLGGIEIQGRLKINRHKFRGVFDGSDGAVNQTLLGICSVRNVTKRC